MKSTATNLLTAIGNAVIRRINHPRHLTRAVSRGASLRARVRPLLSQDDEAEVRQTCALVMVRAGLQSDAMGACDALARMHTLCPLFTSNREGIARTHARAMHTLPLSTWRALFRESRQILRMGRRALTDEISTAPDEMPEVPLYGMRDTEAEPQRRAMIARRMNYLRACIAARFAADKSRKRLATRNASLRYLRMATRALAGFGHGAPDAWKSDSARRVAAMRFRDYIARGEELLTAATLADAPTYRATLACNERGEMKTFAALG